MEFLKDFGDIQYVAIRGIDEFGNNSYVVDRDGYNFKISELPITHMNKDEKDENNGISYKLFGMSVAKNNRTTIKAYKQVPYLHLLNKKGKMYFATCSSQSNQELRPLDGDIIYKVGGWSLYDSPNQLVSEMKKLENEGGSIKILRIQGGKYIQLDFRVEAGNWGAEYHLMPVTKEETIKIPSI